MTHLDTILAEAKRLSATDQAKLVEEILQSLRSDPDGEEVLVGQRGLVNLTESMRNEDWSAFYPKSLRAHSGQ